MERTQIDIPVIVSPDLYTVVVVRPNGDEAPRVTVSDFGNELPLDLALQRVVEKVRRHDAIRRVTGFDPHPDLRAAPLSAES